MTKSNHTAKALAYATIVIPTFGAVCAVVLAAIHGLRGSQVALLAAMYTVTMLGVTMGYHRLFAHRSFQTTRWMRALLGILGSMAAQGPVLFWAAVHRRHHQRSDQPGDPHSPVTDLGSKRASLRGLWHAHVGWMLGNHDVSVPRAVPDLMKDKTLLAIDRAYPISVLAGLAIPALLGGALAESWAGAGYGFLWGGLLRIFVAHHVTWCINSLCHFVGTRPFQTPDLSRNNFVLAVLTFGEGWHNNHHASPGAARHGIHWWQVDTVYYIVRILEGLEIVRNVRMRPITGRRGSARVHSQT